MLLPQCIRHAGHVPDGASVRARPDGAVRFTRSFTGCAGADAGYFSEFVIHRHFPLHSFQEYVFLDPLYHFIYVLISTDICKLEWSVTTHFF